MPSPNNYWAFLKAGYTLRELGFAFVRLKVCSSIWTRIKYSFRRRGARVLIDYTVDIAGSRFIEIDDDSWLQRNVWLTVPLISMNSIADKTYILIGKRVHIGRNSFIAASNNIELADDVLIGPYVTIVDHTHQQDDPERPIRDQGITQTGFVKIARGAWIGAGATILGHRGITIGENAVVAADAVLTKDLHAHHIAVGNPAQIKKKSDR